jgi:hypothetical protein
MALMDLLASAQGGQFFANAGKASGMSDAAAEKAMHVLAPAIAERLHDKAKTDEDAFEKLVDLLDDDDGTFDLEDPASVMGAEAVADGEAILRDIYGGQAAVRPLLAKLVPGADPTSLEQLAAIAATSVLAALTQNYRAPQTLVGAQGVASSTGGGLLGTILSAVVEGAMKGAASQLAPKKRRRRRSYASYWNAPRKRRTTRRKRANPTLNDIFGAILGNRR